MGLFCANCNYPASSPPTCSECGAREFYSSKAPSDPRWWALLVGVVALQNLAAWLTLVYGILEYRRTMANLSSTGVIPKLPSTDVWPMARQYLGMCSAIDIAALVALPLGTLSLLLAVCVRRWRKVLTTAAAALCLLRFALAIWQQGALAITLLP